MVSLLCLRLSAQELPSATIAKVDSIYKAFAEKSHSPGLVYGIVYGGKLLHIGHWGYSNLEEQIAADGNKVFRIASMSKSFIGVAVMKLRDEGKLQLDDPVSRYIPELKAQKLLTSDAPAITIRHLLSHAAGFPEDNPWGDRQLDISKEQLLALINKGFSFSNSPGVTYEYSNTAFALLGYLIERITGVSYNEYVNREIWQPLGMKSTYWEYADVPSDKLAIGYRWVKDKWVKQPMLHDGAYGAMGGVLTSMEDFSKYVLFHLNAWPARDGIDNGPVKRASLREMQHPWNFNSLNATNVYTDGTGCPITASYGFGLRWSHDCRGRTTIGHSGGLPGFGSNWIMLPDYGLGLICFSNVTYAAATAINAQAMDALIQDAGLQARAVPASSVLEQRKKELLAFLPNWKDEAREAVFADNFFLDNYDYMLRETCQQLFEEVGKIERIDDIVAQNNLRGTFVVHGEKGSVSIYFTLSPEADPKIQEFKINKLP